MKSVIVFEKFIINLIFKKIAIYSDTFLHLLGNRGCRDKKIDRFWTKPIIL